MTSANTLNTPNKQGITGNNQGVLISTDTSGNYSGQLWFDKVNVDIFTRGKSSGTWSAWVKR